MTNDTSFTSTHVRRVYRNTDQLAESTTSDGGKSLLPSTKWPTIARDKQQPNADKVRLSSRNSVVTSVGGSWCSKHQLVLQQFKAV